jgi:hypothetical protein
MMEVRTSDSDEPMSQLNPTNSEKLDSTYNSHDVPSTNVPAPVIRVTSCASYEVEQSVLTSLYQDQYVPELQQ